MSGDTEDYLDDLGKLFVANLKRYNRAEPLQNIVNKTLGFVPNPTATVADPEAGQRRAIWERKVEA